MASNPDRTRPVAVLRILTVLKAVSLPVFQMRNAAASLHCDNCLTLHAGRRTIRPCIWSGTRRPRGSCTRDTQKNNDEPLRPRTGIPAPRLSARRNNASPDARRVTYPSSRFVPCIGTLSRSRARRDDERRQSGPPHRTAARYPRSPHPERRLHRRVVTPVVPILVLHRRLAWLPGGTEVRSISIELEKANASSSVRGSRRKTHVAAFE